MRMNFRMKTQRTWLSTQDSEFRKDSFVESWRFKSDIGNVLYSIRQISCNKQHSRDQV